MEVIPAIDLIDGTVVRLYQGDFARITEYDNDPLELARRYADAGAKRLHVIDLDGAKTGKPINLPVISSLVETGMVIQAGGGIRDFKRLRSLFNAGVEYAVVGSVAINQPDVVAAWMEEVGGSQIILAFDVRLNKDNEPEVLTHGWTKSSGSLLWPLMDFFLAQGAKQFLCTDIGKDGTLQGPNVDLYLNCTRRYPDADFIASGGVSCAADLEELDRTGVASVVTGKALLDGWLTLEEIDQFSRGE